MGQGLGNTGPVTDESGTFVQALYQGAWLPCRVLRTDPETSRVLVRLTDRTGTHDTWVEATQVRNR